MNESMQIGVKSMHIKLIDNETIGVFFDYDHDMVQFVKSRPGARYQPNGRFWYFPVDSNLGSTISVLQDKCSAIVDERAMSRLVEITALKTQNLASLLPESGKNLPLYPFQEETAKFMITAGSALNANFVGSGKTLTSLAVCQALKAKKVLVVVPKSVLMQWAQIEIPKWLPNAKVFPVVGDKLKRGYIYAEVWRTDNCFVVVGYETARIDIEFFKMMKWDVFIADEAHKLANTTTKLYKSFRLIQSSHRFGLTATPVMNKPDDLFGIINWLRPGALGSWWQFMNRYIVKDYFGSPKYYRHMDELAERCKPFIIKKTLEEVGMQLPPYTEEILPVELNPRERKNYDLMKKELLFDILPMVINKIENPAMLQHTVVKLGKLFELCDSMELIGEHKDSSKLEMLKEHLESTLVNGNKAIIITRFSRMAEILFKTLSETYGALIITGATNDRASILKEFASGDSKNILIGTEAIGQGLNLQAANVLYNYDSAWNPARMEQRAGRIYRDGQQKPVFIYNLVTQKSVEVWLQKKLIKKQELSEQLLPKSFVEIKEMLEDG